MICARECRSEKNREKNRIYNTRAQNRQRIKRRESAEPGRRHPEETHSGAGLGYGKKKKSKARVKGKGRGERETMPDLAGRRGTPGRRTVQEDLLEKSLGKKEAPTPEKGKSDTRGWRR